MKIIKYQLMTEVNRGTTAEPNVEQVFSTVSMPYTEANYAIAQSEAYNGEVTVEDDGTPEPEKSMSYEDRLSALETAIERGLAL